jgi:hypothetical protein
MYAILFSILFSLFAGVLSLFTFSVSLVIKRFKILLFLPAYLFITLTNTLDSLFYNGNNFMSYKIFQYVTVNAQFGKNPLFLAVVVMLLLSISVVLIIRQAHIDQLD